MKTKVQKINNRYTVVLSFGGYSYPLLLDTDWKNAAEWHKRRLDACISDFKEEIIAEYINKTKE